MVDGEYTELISSTTERREPPDSEGTMTTATSIPARPAVIDFESTLRIDADDVFETDHDYRVEIDSVGLEPNVLVFQFRTAQEIDSYPDYDDSRQVDRIGNTSWAIAPSPTESHKVTLDISSPAENGRSVGRAKSTDTSHVSAIAIYDNVTSLQHRGLTGRAGFTITSTAPTSGQIRLFTL
jgi:hypothetical protein